MIQKSRQDIPNDRGPRGDRRRGLSEWSCAGYDSTASAGRYALGLLFLAYVLNYIDRQIINILQDPIKLELGFSDSQLGLLTGLSFALFYAVLGLPMARLADRYPRRIIISVSMSLWSVMTALCAAATSFGSLLLFRVGVGVGEAGLTPAAHSMISDHFPQSRRISALAIYSAAGPVGVMVGFLIGGWINEYFGWRPALIVAGLPGIALAVIIWVTLREPRRGRFDPPSASDDDRSHQTRTGGGLGALLTNRRFVMLALGCGFHAFVIQGIGNWTPPFFGRLHGMGSGELGTALAVLSVPSIMGMVGAGYLADWLGKRTVNAGLKVAVGSIVALVPIQTAMLLVPRLDVALALSAVCHLLAGVYLAPCIATGHTFASAGQRASASAVVLLGVNLIGLGCGPMAAGFLSDHWAAWGENSLRYAMAALIPADLLSVTFLVLAARPEGPSPRAG